MSGTKTSRADLKNRFKKGMYPTEGDFANVFESYVHKDDDIPMSKVVLTDGDGNTTTLNNVIGNKADKTDLTEITNRLTTAENDIDAAEDNIAGHETRIQGLEAFKERVRAFLEDADASEETINRWHEIESFLQGITDTQTLTGLLNDLKQEILAQIPQGSTPTGNYLKLISDLDAYTDAPDGEIVKYTGPTTDSYTHGFDYERVVSSTTTESIVEGQPVEYSGHFALDLDGETYIWNFEQATPNPFYILYESDINAVAVALKKSAAKSEGNMSVGGYYLYPKGIAEDGNVVDISVSDGESVTIGDLHLSNGAENSYPYIVHRLSDGKTFVLVSNKGAGFLTNFSGMLIPYSASGIYDLNADDIVYFSQKRDLWVDDPETVTPFYIAQVTAETASWQLIPSMPVIQ